MTTRNIALAINTTAIPEVGRLLAEQGITLGPILSQKGRMRCFAIEGQPRLPLPVGGLDYRDIATLHGFADGLGYREIAEMLGIAEATFKEYARRLYRRLDACDRASAVAQAYRMGVLDRREVAA